MIRISIVEQGGASRLVTFDQPQVTIGRLPDNDLALVGQGVSSRHARIFAAPDGVYLEDLGSTNGTFVNRQRLTVPARVGQSDEIVLAVYQLRIFDGAATATAQPPSASSAAGPQTARPPVGVPVPVTREPTGIVAGPAAAGTAPAPPSRAAGPEPGRPSTVDAKAAAWAREWETIDVLARDWLARGRDRKKLLRGAKLAHAKKWLGSGRGRTPPPTREHKDFIRASHRAAQGRVFRNVAVGGLVLGVIAAAVVVSVAKPEPLELDRAFVSGLDGGRPSAKGPSPAERRAESDALAKAAQGQLDDSPDTAALLSVVALQRLPSTETSSAAHDASRLALGALAFEALRAHEGTIHDAAFSADGRWAVTAGADLSARLWDLGQAGRRKPLSLRGHTQAVRFVVITPDSKFLVTGGDDGKLFRWALTETDPLTTAAAIPGHDSEVSAMALSGDGRLLVTASIDGTVRMHRVEAGGSSRVTDHAGPVRGVGVDGTGARVITAGADGTAMLYNVAEGKPTRRIRLEGHEGEVRTVCVAPDASWAITGSDDGTARLWDPSKRYPATSVRILAGHEGPVTHAVITQDSKLAITGGKDGKLFVWNLEAKQPELGATTFDLHKGAITDLRTIGPGADPERPKTRWLLSASEDATARTWNLETRERAQQSVELEAGAPVRAVASSIDGRWVVTGGDDGLARLWDPAEQGAAGAARVARGSGTAVLSLALNRVGTRLAAAGDDGVVTLWDVISTGPLRSLATLQGHRGRVRSVAFTPDSEFVATAGDDGVVRLWKASSATVGHNHLPLKGHSKVVNELRFTPDGSRLVSISADRSARIWKMDTRDPSKAVTVLPHRDEVNTMDISGDGRWLFTGTISRLRVWDLSASDIAKSGRSLNHPHDKDISVVAIDPAGKYGVSASVDATVVLWTLGEGGGASRLRQHDQPVEAAAFSPDGRWLATGSQDSTIRLYDLRAAHPEESSLELRGHDKTVGTLRFGRDGRYLVSGSNDGSLRVWDTAAGDEKAVSSSAGVLRGHDALVSDVRISTDGRFIASGSYDGSARVWPLLPEDISELLCRRAGRSLTPQEWERWVPARRYRAICDGG